MEGESKRNRCRKNHIHVLCKMAQPNHLIHQTSPYLLQHAYNPVQWYPWCDEAFEKAISENKLVLISIGYSACHWCHVMEHEVFENEEAADFMNRYFINIKVDREERPDIDQVYMLAVQLMTQRGGWPLNCFALPDGRPVYGGTYFPLSQWMNLLENLVEIQRREPEKFVEYATKLAQGIGQMDQLIPPTGKHEYDMGILTDLVKTWSESWDLVNGGTKRAPKFPMPVQLNFLLDFKILSSKISTVEKSFVQLLENHLNTTLRKMALGGIYDQIGGGFARYSVDEIWKVPHFEKMLYDNAQLLSVYSKAFRETGIELYEDVILQTSEFIFRELTSDEGLFYSALDADSEGEEGKYYTWTLSEFEEVTGEDFAIASEYYNLNAKGHWEDGSHILLCELTEEEFAGSIHMDPLHLKERLKFARRKLLNHRAQRIKPGLDNKCITSWNAMAISGLCEAYKATASEKLLHAAVQAMESILKYQFHTDTLLHCRTAGQSHISGFHDDYVFMTGALLDLYETTANEKWLKKADVFANLTVSKFLDDESGLCWFTEKGNSLLFARKKELEDNVIPSSNSQMAAIFSRLSVHLERKEYAVIAEKMLSVMLQQINAAPGYCGWLSVYEWLACEHHEVVFTGNEALIQLQKFHSRYFPNCIVAASTFKSSLPLFKDKPVEPGEVYVCTGSTCHSPTNDIGHVFELLK